MRGSAFATKTILPSLEMITLDLPAGALDMTVLEWRLEDVIVAVENARWDIVEAGLLNDDEEEEEEEEGGSNLKGR